MRDFQTIKSHELRVGDLVLLQDGDKFAADFALLTSSNSGDAFIKTSSLDGEKNLKKREQPKDLDIHFPTNDLKPDAYRKVAGKIEVELPNKKLDSFKGVLYINNKEYFFSADQLLMKAADLANTDWVVGVCCYTGEETKIMLNSLKGK